MKTQFHYVCAYCGLGMWKDDGVRLHEPDDVPKELRKFKQTKYILSQEIAFCPDCDEMLEGFFNGQGY